MMQFDECDRAKAVLHEAEELFRSMADASPCTICCSGPDGNATFFNKKWLDFTGRAMDQELGHGWAEGVHPLDRDRTLAAIASSFASRTHCYVEYRLRRADGVYRWVLCSGVPRFEPGGAFAGYIATGNDITDEKLSQERAVAAQRLEGLGLLVKGISHRFNNLLGGILASAEVALAARAEGLPIDDELRKIRDASMRGAEIVRELAVYGEEKGSALEPLDLADLIRGMLPLLKGSISSRNTLDLHLGQNLPLIEGNRGRLRELLVNLIINASESIGTGGGTITLKADVVEERGDALAAAPDVRPGTYVQLGISDTGCGMTSEVQAKIFDPYFTTKNEGRGLGLAVVKKILEDHNAAITVVSKPGNGTSILAWFPAGKISTPSVPKAARPVSEKPPKILFVEDEEVLRLAVVKGLRRRGFSVLEASDGPAALNQISSQGVDVEAMILDLILPGMSSRAVLEEVRRIKPGLKVILTSAYAKETAIASFGGMRVDSFIRKPFHLNDIESLLHEMIAPERT